MSRPPYALLLLLLCGSLAGAATETATVSIHVAGNRTFYWNDRPLRYLVLTEDPASGDTLHGTLPVERTSVHSGYVAHNAAIPKEFFSAGGESAAVGHGRVLINAQDCLLCHTIAGTGVISSFTVIGRAANAAGGRKAELTNTISKGSTTNIGGIQMPPHPGLSPADVSDVVDFILSLQVRSGPSLLPLRSDQLIPDDAVVPSRDYVLTAAYDRGGTRTGNGPTTSSQLRLRSPLLLVSDADGSHALRIESSNKDAVATGENAGAYLYFNNIDLTDVAGVVLYLSEDSQSARADVGRLVLRLDGVSGREVGEVLLDGKKKDPTQLESALRRLLIVTNHTEGPHRVFVVLEQSGSGSSHASLAAIEFVPQSGDGS
jgi:cytochrome c